MNSENTFRTKTGFCHLTADKIILTRDGDISHLTVGENVKRVLIAYGIFSAGLLYMAYDGFRKGDFLMTFLFGLFGGYLIYEIVKNKNNSGTPVINRKDITKVMYIPARSRLTPPRFEVLFNDNGQIRKRLIMLPGTSSSGETEVDKAVQIMKEEKLLN